MKISLLILFCFQYIILSLFKLVSSNSISLESLLTMQSNKNLTHPSKIPLDDILLETIQNSPKHLLPALPKIVTKSGLLCDFPFVYDNKKFYDQCAMRADEKSYCKVHFKTSKANEILSKISDNKIFESFLDTESGTNGVKLLKVKDEYFSECLSVDETEQYLNELVDESFNYDFKKKLLIDLFSEIKSAINELREDKLNLLFELSENFCKSTNFSFDCLFENLILPISKTKELTDLTKSIFDIFEKYKFKLQRMVDKSLNMRYRQLDFQYINTKNVNFNPDQKERNQTKMVSESPLVENEIETLISKEVIEKNSVYSKISIRQYFEILISIYEICTNECKVALEYLFIDNFMQDIERIKLEVVLRLFNYTQVNETEFFSKIFPKDHYHINYKNILYPINEQSERFLNYKAWSPRYLISIIYRYILMEKLFYIDIIKGELTEENLNKILFFPKTYLNDKEKAKLIKTVPLLTPYITFSDEMKEKLAAIYDQNANLTNDVQSYLTNTNETLSKFRNVTIFLSDVLKGRIDFITQTGNKQLSSVKEYKKKIENLSDVLQSAHAASSVFKSIELESQLKNLNYLINNIYKINYLSQECHKFLHYHTYFQDFSFGKPLLSYVSLSFEPFFFVDFEKEIKLFFIYGLINMNLNYKKKYNVTIKTQAKVDLYVKSLLREPIEVKQLPDSDRFKNMVQQVFVIETPGFTNAYKEMVIKGRFENKNESNKYIEARIYPYDDYKGEDHNNNEATSKCAESLIDISMCFNPYAYKVNCEVACKFLSEKITKKLLERNYIKESEKSFYGDVGQSKNANATNSMSNNKRLKDAKQKINVTNSVPYQDTIKPNIDSFLSTCNGYCSTFMWTIPVYKCLTRNLIDHEFEALLVKCGTTGNWKLIGRKTLSSNNSTSWYNHYKEFTQNDILFGKKFLVENSNKNVQLKLVPYIQPSILNPLSNVTFIQNFQYDSISEYLFTSGDMGKFLVLDKYQPFIKGIPFTAFSPFNEHLFGKLSSMKRESFETSIFNLIYDDEKMDNKSIVIYGKKYTFKPDHNYVLFSDNEKFNRNNKNEQFEKEKFSLMREQSGVNLLVRSNNAVCTIGKPFFTSNLNSKEFYTENTLLTKNIFAFVDSNYLILRVPEQVDGKALLLKTNPYQTKYSININERSRIYLSIEITKYFTIIAEGLHKDGWKFLNGTVNMLEIITSDLGDDILNKSEYSFYECNFSTNENNPICSDNVFSNIEKIQMSLFYKEIDVGTHPFSYSFFDFDDLYGCLHLLFLQPLECRMNKGSLFTYKDKVNNFLKIIEDNLPSFDPDIEQYEEDVSKSEFAILRVPINLTDNTMMNTIFNLTDADIKKSRARVSEDKFSEYVMFLETHYNYTIQNSTAARGNNRTESVNPANHETPKLTPQTFKTQLLGHKNYSKPLVKFNQNGCVLGLDRFGNLYSKQLSDIISRSNTSYWQLIKTYVKSFELSENVLMVMNVQGALQMQRGFNQKNECRFDPDHWININFDIKGLYVKKFAFSQFNCFWIVDNNNKIYYVTEFDFLSGEDFELDIDPVTIDPDKEYQYKNIYLYADKLYLVTRTNEVLVKKNIFNIYKNKCEKGSPTEKIREFSRNTDIKLRKIQVNIHSPFVGLDDKGNLYYRQFTNEINLLGDEWELMQVFNDNELNRVVDFHMGPKDIMSINANGRILILYDINRPRLYDD